MSTPNFNNKNASKIFASECEEEWDYEDLIGNILSDKRLKKYTEEKDTWETNYNHSYPSSVFGNRQIWKNIWIIDINLISRSGYYLGVNLDWEVNIQKDSVKDYWDEEDIDIYSDDLPQYIQNLLESEIKKIEKVYADYTTPLICRGIFSNGEAVYEKAKK